MINFFFKNNYNNDRIGPFKKLVIFTTIIINNNKYKINIILIKLFGTL